MTWTSVNSDAPVRFTTTSFSYTIPSGSPTAGQVDVIGVTMSGSGTITATPSGWAAGPTITTSGGGTTTYYLYYRIAAGGESATVSLANNMIAGSPNFAEAMLIWQRWSTSSGTITADQAGSAANSTNASATPSVSTGTLAATGELSIAYAGMFNGPTPLTGLSWSPAAYAVPTNNNNSSGSGGVHNATAYNSNAGTAAESPSVSWTSGAIQSQAILIQTFQATTGSSPIVPGNQHLPSYPVFAVNRAGISRVGS